MYMVDEAQQANDDFIIGSCRHFLGSFLRYTPWMCNMKGRAKAPPRAHAFEPKRKQNHAHKLSSFESRKHIMHGVHPVPGLSSNVKT